MEGLTEGNAPLPLPQTLLVHGSFERRFCTRDMLTAAGEFVPEIPRPKREEARPEMGGGELRGGAGDNRIVESMQEVSLSDPGMNTGPR